MWQGIQFMLVELFKMETMTWSLVLLKLNRYLLAKHPLLMDLLRMETVIGSTQGISQLVKFQVSTTYLGAPNTIILHLMISFIIFILQSPLTLLLVVKYFIYQT
jgi:hypothetical protein